MEADSLTDVQPIGLFFSVPFSLWLVKSVICLGGRGEQRVEKHRDVLWNWEAAREQHTVEFCVSLERRWQL